MDELSMIRYHVHMLRKQTNLSTYEESAYNHQLDQRLNSLVLVYDFNFQAIALHLSFQFPHYDYKITKKSIAYRWFQLSVQARPLIDQSIRKKNRQYLANKAKQQEKSEKHEVKHKNILNNNEENLQKLNQAFKMAQNLDDEQLGGFVIYKPKFSSDSQFSLERQQFKQQKIKQIVNNQFLYDFGLFENASECAVPSLPEKNYSKHSSQDLTLQSQSNADAAPVKSNPQKQVKQKKIVQDYCFEVQDYESD